MTLSPISTLARNNNLVYSLKQLNHSLIKSEVEAVTGHSSDAVQKLGQQNGNRVSLMTKNDRLQGIIDSNSLANGRLATTQIALSTTTSALDNVLPSLISDNHGKTTGRVVQESARSALGSTLSNLNSSIAGDYVFSGIQTNTAPFSSTAHEDMITALDDAFVAKFGFAKDDPAADNITQAQMEDFLTNDAEPLFNETNWKANFSNASDTVMNTRISEHESIDTSVSANISGVRDAVKSLAIAEAFSGYELPREAMKVVTDRVIAIQGAAKNELVRTEGDVGFIQERVTNASTYMQRQYDLQETSISEYTEVDRAEAATTMNNILNQIEASYAITQRIQNLSILKYM